MSNDPGAQPPAPAPTPTPTDPPPANPPARKPEEYESEIKSLRGEAASYRTQLRDAQKAIDELKAKYPTEVADLTTKLTTLEQSLGAATERAVQSELKAVAAKLGFKDPGDAIALLDKSKLTVRDGQPENGEALLAELAKTKPYLLGQPGKVDAGAGGQPGALDMNALIRLAAGVS